MTLRDATPVALAGIGAGLMCLTATGFQPWLSTGAAFVVAWTLILAGIVLVTVLPHEDQS